jgi:hypothetical protein
MAQTGFTPIQIYSSSSTGNTPAAADLLNSTGGSELAINIFDGKLFYKDSSNAVQVIGWKIVPVSAGGTGVTSASITAFNNITGYTATGATGTTSTNLVFSTSPTLVTPTIGVATATSINKMAITAPATSSTLTIADGKTLTANRTLTLNGTDGKTLSVNNSIALTGTDSTTMTFPTTSATIARTDAAQTFTGTQSFGLINTTDNVLAGTTNASGTLANTKNCVSGRFITLVGQTASLPNGATEDITGLVSIAAYLVVCNGNNNTTTFVVCTAYVNSAGGITLATISNGNGFTISSPSANTLRITSLVTNQTYKYSLTRIS